MTEKTWLTSKQPRKMLDAIRGEVYYGMALQLGWDDAVPKTPSAVRGKVSDRKARLFAVACCRVHSHPITDKGSLKALEVAERFADGLASKREVAEARKQFTARARDELRRKAIRAALAQGCDEDEAEARMVAALIGWDVSSALRASAWDAAAHCLFEADMDADRPPAERARTLAALLREVAGNPFRPVKFGPRWRTANVEQLAATIYEERAFDRLPILADALMDAGCDSAPVLDHCRSDGPHVRGCWVLDLILGRQ